MTGFSIDWLDLREGADLKARDKSVLDRAVSWLREQAREPDAVMVMDIGAGTGATLRAFQQQYDHQTTISWRLVDHDPVLLDEARRRHAATHQLELLPGDLARVTSLPTDHVSLITASALFDLVSASFIDALVSHLQSSALGHPPGVYAALNYDGLMQWAPQHPLDATVLRAFNQDQRRDKGFGPALGPEASAYMERAFSAAGFNVLSASSPWQLDGDDRQMLSALIDGIANAVSDAPGIDARTLQEWVKFRQSHAANGTCIIGHRDVLALPY